ncbi:acetyltransferase [Vibrio splendidus]|jgi:sugar O-acyltransferase (sialic acid O-acetyltransferase NeuD family)|uniref:acetyltransferase n=2 Tax=Vibrio splendidus TaxID=29497 RepID=UPI000C844844|nr:acetyltransferase [Vibrio splendidus]MCQ8869331.1 acetyltransferase [Vibrio splendidus]MDH5896546.1 acetyltransferase [Vibrio splendidus]MDH6028038.1 acetyltransferase [Vibrio splendidus]PMG54292.1 sugar O-acyltransferase [Vibrio splendidus]PMH70926.1 sugar O-acyltransferase [Vibrio splendidus]
MHKVIIFGLGDNAELAHYYFSNDSDYQVVAFTVNQEYKKVENFCDLPVISFEDIDNHYKKEDCHIFIAMGYGNMNSDRENVYNKAKSDGWICANYISSRATILTNSIGDNNFILEDNTIQPFVSIGNNNVIWSGNHIGHHGVIGDHNFITSQVTISGRVDIENNCFIGVNSSIRDHIKISYFTLIGAHSWISKNTKPYEVYTAKQTPLFPKTSDRLKI